jgi:hypothetical protein
MNKGMGGACTLALLLAFGSARADWLPQWVGVWQHEETFHGVVPIALMAAGDGGAFAIVDTTHHNAAHASLMRFDAQGGFEWLGEAEALSVADGVAVAPDRIAIAGSMIVDSSIAAFARVYASTSGDLLHECTWSGVSFLYDERQQTRAIAAGVDDTLYVRAHDGGDLVVLRCDAQGNALPEWRWDSGAADARTDDLMVLADGDVLLGGRVPLGDGYYTVRFDADGSPIVVDHELGEIGNALGALHLAEDAGGDLLLAAAPESSFGVPQAQAWKVKPDGTRLWTRVIGIEGQVHPNHDIGGFAMAPDGDLVIATSPSSGQFRVLRLAGADGEPRWDTTAPVHFTPSGLALAANGRVLVGGFASIPGSGGFITSHLAEFRADGQPCRTREDFGMNTKLRVTSGAGGWSMLGAGPFLAAGNDASVHRYDDDGPCDIDAIFLDGFDA